MRPLREPTETAEADAAVSDEFRDPQEVIDLSAEAEQADAPTQATTETTSTTGGNVVTIDATNLSVDTVITPEMLSGGMTTGQNLPAHTVVKLKDIEVVGGHSPVNALSGMAAGRSV